MCNGQYHLRLSHQRNKSLHRKRVAETEEEEHLSILRPKKGSFISNLLTRRDSPSRSARTERAGSSDGTVSPPSKDRGRKKKREKLIFPRSATMRAMSGNVSVLSSSSGKVKPSTSGSSVFARDGSSSSSAASQASVEAELQALRNQVRLLQSKKKRDIVTKNVKSIFFPIDMLMIEQENSHRRDGGATDRAATAATASPHRRSGSFTAYNGEW